MNNKGFTLIELIMVIAILAMLMVFVAPNVVKLINKNKVDNYNSTLDSIIEATEIYVSNNRYDNTKLSFDNNCKPSDGSDKNITSTITLKTLIDNKDITDVTENSCTNEEINPEEVQIKISLNCGTKNFSYELIDNGDNFAIDADNKIIRIDDGKTCSDLY